jgi:hypothetical protein
MLKKILLVIVCILMMLPPITADAQTYTSQDEVYRIIRKNLLAHKEQFTIEMNIEVMNKIGKNTDLLDKAAVLDYKSTSKDGDYLRFSVSQWSSHWQWYTNGKTAVLDFSATYRTTLKQEKELDAEIKRVIKALKLTDKSDYTKVKRIHDYIIKKTVYDQSLENHTAYNTLIEKTAVCDGYSLAAYRLLTVAGIDNRVITGLANGGSHSWNIVKINNKWYNLDLTWDDPITDTGEQILTYDYFLKNDSDFKNHKRDAKYRTSAFIKKYPIAKESYKLAN